KGHGMRSLHQLARATGRATTERRNVRQPGTASTFPGLSVTRRIVTGGFLALAVLGFPLSAYNHDGLQGLRNGKGSPCCSSHDCSLVMAGGLRPFDDGTFLVFMETDWFPVLETNILRDQSPNGLPYVCPNHKPHNRRPFGEDVPYRVRCLILPKGM